MCDNSQFHAVFGRSRVKPHEQLAWERSIKLGKCDEMMHIRCPGTGVLQGALPVLSLWREEWGKGGRRSPLLGTCAWHLSF